MLGFIAMTYLHDVTACQQLDRQSGRLTRITFGQQPKGHRLILIPIASVLLGKQIAINQVPKYLALL